MAEYKVTLSAEEEKALLADVISIQDWLNNAIHNKARQCIDRVVGNNSDKQPNKLARAEKLTIVRSADVKSATERTAEMEATMGIRDAKSI